MTPRGKGRTQVCGHEAAATRLAHARKFLEVASIAATEEDVPESASVAASLAVLAGIAAADAACCSALGQRSRGQDHHEAEALVSQIVPDGAKAAQALRRLLDLKDAAQYGFFSISGQKLTSSLRQAEQLIAFAAAVVRR